MTFGSNIYDTRPPFFKLLAAGGKKLRFDFKRNFIKYFGQFPACH